MITLLVETEWGASCRVLTDENEKEVREWLAGFSPDCNVREIVDGEYINTLKVRDIFNK